VAVITTERQLLFVSDALWAHFHKRWRDIDREWLPAAFAGPTIGSLDAMHVLRAAREDLRSELRQLAPSFPGSYPIAV
jgi:hypothetical protein